MSDTTLPEAFAELEALADVWAKPTENARSEIRWNSTAEEFKRFYEVAMPRLNDMLDSLSQNKSEDLDAPHRRLYYLACALSEATPHHELYRGSAQVPFSFDARRFIPTHGGVDSVNDQALR